MDVERHRGILETILSRAKDEEDVVKRLSNYMALLLYCYEEAEEVRGYFTLLLEEKGLDTLQIANLVNQSGKRWASTRLTAKAEKRLAKVRARIEQGQAPDSYAYELFTSLEKAKRQEAGNHLLTPIQTRQATRAARMMSAARALFKGAKVAGLALVPGFILHKLSATGTAGTVGGVTASAASGAVAAPAGLAAVIPIATGAVEAAAPVVAPIAGKAIAGWVATGLLLGASGVVSYEATTGTPVIPAVAQPPTASPESPRTTSEIDPPSAEPPSALDIFLSLPQVPRPRLSPPRRTSIIRACPTAGSHPYTYANRAATIAHSNPNADTQRRSAGHAHGTARADARSVAGSAADSSGNPRIRGA